MSPEELNALWQVIVVDLVLAGDNAIVVGLAAASVPERFRGRVVAAGIAIAVVMRILFSVVVAQLFAIRGLVLVGGLLLLWVAWRFFEDLRSPKPAHEPDVEVALNPDGSGAASSPAAPTSLWRAMTQIVVADFSMSLDNVLAVAGAAREHPYVLVFGLLLSVAAMGVLATVIARMLERFRWIAWAGLAVIVYVALKMILDGSAEVGLFA